MKIKILFLILVLFLLIGCQSDVTEDSENDVEDSIENDNSEEGSEFYDDLDNALSELDELENLQFLIKNGKKEETQRGIQENIFRKSVNLCYYNCSAYSYMVCCFSNCQGFSFYLSYIQVS